MGQGPFFEEDIGFYRRQEIVESGGVLNGYPRGSKRRRKAKKKNLEGLWKYVGNDGGGG